MERISNRGNTTLSLCLWNAVYGDLLKEQKLLLVLVRQLKIDS